MTRVAKPTTPGARDMGGGWWLRVALALAARPSLWVTAVAQVFRVARRGWWRRPPFLPLPDRAYVHFRLETAYGSTADAPSVDDVVTYLHWCRAFPRA